MAAARPTIDELLEATQEFLEKKIIHTVDSHRAFHTRVAINVLRWCAGNLRWAHSSHVKNTSDSGHFSALMAQLRN